MAIFWNEIEERAAKFAMKWKSREGKERQNAQSFLRDFLFCFGINDPLASGGSFEYKSPKSWGDDGYIDYFLPKKLIVEMKSIGADLKKAILQVRDYVVSLPADEMPALILVSDFEFFELTQRESGKTKVFRLSAFKKHVKQFAILAGYEPQRLRDDANLLAVNIAASEKMAKLHEALEHCGYEGHELEVILVRLLFSMFAEDTGIFVQDDFLNYVENSKEDGSDLGPRLIRLFEVLNIAPEKRAQRSNLPQDLRPFQYIDGSIFSELLETPDFDRRMRQTLIDCALFDWSQISPAIFGSMFQGILDPTARRDFGAHYTSEENILKLLNPLFMDELWAKFEAVKADPRRLADFHQDLARLRILDPACGCGNFLILAYREIRRLELEILKMQRKTGQRVLDVTLLSRIDVDQFYGIEIQEFPSQVARVAMWLMDHLMNIELSDTFGQNYARLPLKQSATIVFGNALPYDWQSLLPAGEHFDFIIGNPPYNGARMMSAEQKADLISIFKNVKNAGNLDYVCAWFKKAAEMMHNTATRTAFVTTNSISQGEQVAILWKPLFDMGMEIDFAYQTFKWSNEAKGKAAVHCVIVGFSHGGVAKEKQIFGEEGKAKKVKQINGYLLNAPHIAIESRNSPLCAVPSMGIGNKPIDGGYYLFTLDEMTDFIAKEPVSAKYFRPWLGSDEFINGYFRYCLWLGEASPKELRQMPESLKRVSAVKTFRLASKSVGTRKIAEKPTRFHVENMPIHNYILIPRVSSEKRSYIPMGFITVIRFCVNNSQRHALPLRHSDIFYSHGMDAHGLWTFGNALSILSNDCLQQFSMARAKR